jgi:glycosyltransferase involved in cell wall biosynthesis
MKILLVITRSELGGAQSVVIELANALCREHSVILAAGEGDGKMWERVDSRVVREHCPHLQRAMSLKNDLLAALELRRVYRRHRPDVVHLHSSKAGVLGRLVLPRRKIVYTVHGFDSVRVAYRKFLPVERLLQHRSHAVVGVSNYDKENMLHEGISRGVSTIYNGIATPETSALRSFEEFDKYDKTILCIARATPPKEPQLFIDIARLMPQYGFIWIGNQSDMSHYNAPANCHFLGNITGAGGYCSKADMLVLPSLYEGLPMVILEAMSLSRPVVASNVGGISEIVHNGVNGYTVSNSAEEFAQKIEYILEDEARYNDFCKASRRIFDESLTVERMVREYTKLYNTAQ